MLFTKIKRIEKPSGLELDDYANSSGWPEKWDDITFLEFLTKHDIVLITFTNKKNNKLIPTYIFFKVGYDREDLFKYLNIKAGAIQLDDGNWLLNKYGKYEPNLTFLYKGPMPKYKKINPIELFNIKFDSDEVGILYGDYFVSKKGTNCFRIKPEAEARHVLIRIDWDGSFNSSRGYLPDDVTPIYHRRASSNSGSTGYTYFVMPIDWHYVIKV